MSRSYVADVQQILDEINAVLVENKKQVIKRNNWHQVLSSFTPNRIRPHWVNECFRKSYFDALSAQMVQKAMEEHLNSLGLSRGINLISSGE